MVKHIYIFILALFLCIQSTAQETSPESKVTIKNENAIIDAVAKYNNEEYKEAKDILLKVIDSNPENDAANYYLGLITFRDKEFDLCEHFFKKAVENDPKNFWYRYRLANFYYATKRVELTIEIYEKLLDDFPKNSELYFELAQLYYTLQNFEAALQTTEEIETVFGKTENTTLFKFGVLQNLKKPQEAYDVLEEYNKEFSSALVLTTLADIQMAAYNDSTAIEYYKEALEIEPEYSPATLGLAETYRLTGKYNDFFKSLNRYISSRYTPAEKKADYLNSLIKGESSNFFKQFKTKLDSVYASLNSVHPNDTSALINTGLYKFYVGEKGEAAKKFGEASDVYPDDKGLKYAYLELLSMNEDWEKLMEQSNIAYKKFPDEPIFIRLESIAAYNLDKIDHVIKCCNDIIKVASKDSSLLVDTYSTLGDIYYTKLGEKNKAYKNYEKALKINSDYNYVLNNYAWYLCLDKKNLKKAYAMSKKTIESEPDNATYLDTFGWILYNQGKALEAKPFFKHAMIYGGKDSATILDHYAEVLYALGEYDLAFVYWNMAVIKNDPELPDLKQKIAERKAAVKKK